jgi:transcriptional/translational regulatory protein YebC/TACO1
MAGHSKWAQIKRKKAVTDAAKSREFGKFAKLIAAESKRAGGVSEAGAGALRLSDENSSC